MQPNETSESLAIRRKILQMAHKAQEGHVPSSLSIVEPVLAVFTDWDVGPRGLDSFILSKGHGCLALYAALASKGLLKSQDLDSIGQKGSALGGHPDMTKIEGVEASTGSLGHGLPMAVGLAYAKMHFMGKGRVFALVGDGECNEGVIWESALLASHHKLRNLTVWVDYNRSGDRALDMEPLAAKWKAFGFQVFEIDGHDLQAIRATISIESDKPTAIIGNSTKGKGVDFMENSPQWHHSPINAEALALGLEALQ